MYWPSPTVDVWNGGCGGAKVFKGEPLAITSDGTKHKL